MSKSVITKRAIAAAFQELLGTMSLDKITVAAVAKKTGINRQTFYYHFHDIHALLLWIYRDSVEQALDTAESRNDMRCALFTCLNQLKANREFVTRTMHGLDAPFMYRFAIDVVVDFTKTFVEEMARGIDISKEDLDLVTRFYTVGLVGTIHDWVSNGMHEEPERLATRIMTMIDGTIEESLRRFAN